MLARQNLPRFTVHQGQIHVNAIHILTANRNAWHAVADLRAKYAQIGWTAGGQVSLCAAQEASMSRATMSPADLRAIRERHASEALIADSMNDGWFVAHADSGALLDLCQRLAEVIEEQARALGRDRCPLCGDPECPAPLLEALVAPEESR